MKHLRLKLARCRRAYSGGFFGGLIGWLLVAAVFCSPLIAASNWPQWRGPDGQGVSDEKGLPTEWSNEANVKWKTALPGRGVSSPIVWSDHIFLTTSIEGAVIEGAQAIKHMDEGKEFKHPDSVGGNRSQTLKVLSIDRNTGKILWERTAYEGRVYDDHHKKGSYAASTPATDGKYVYAFFGSEGLYCYDFKGTQVWKQSFGGIATLGMGTAASPVLFQNLVILQCDEDAGEKSFIVAVDKNTGKQVWRTPRKVQASWATPILVRAAGRTELITSGNEFVISYDPATGKEYWRCRGLESNAIPTPLAGHNMVFISAGYPAKRTIAIKLGGSGDLTNSPNIAWKYEKGTAYVPSPILYGDYIYLTTDRGILTCLDARTGEIKYEGGRVPVPATFTASPVAFDGKILLTSEDGDTFVVKAGPKHELLKTNSLGEAVYASPAVSDGKIFIRSDKSLYCIGKS
jgi:outer membrane protein assembly factor BamB